MVKSCPGQWRGFFSSGINREKEPVFKGPFKTGTLIFWILDLQVLWLWTIWVWPENCPKQLTLGIHKAAQTILLCLFTLKMWYCDTFPSLFCFNQNLSPLVLPMKTWVRCWDESLLAQGGRENTQRIFLNSWSPKRKLSSQSKKTLKPNVPSFYFLCVSQAIPLNFSCSLCFFSCVHFLSTGCWLCPLTCGWLYLIPFMINRKCLD